MGSVARKQFDSNIRDIHLLLDHYFRDELLAESGGAKIPERADVLFRSAIVLLVSHWEAYIEDICEEALQLIVKEAPSSKALSDDIKRHIARELKESKNELEPWKIADGGWRQLLTVRLGQMKDARNRIFNSPKTSNVSDFVERTLGLKNIQSNWKLEDYSAADCAEKLDELIEIRGSIAHRGKSRAPIDKIWIEDHLRFIEMIASKTGGSINRHVRKMTGASLW